VTADGPGGRRRGGPHDPERRRSQLLEAAFEAFTASGYRATRLEDVARRAGVTKGCLYHYFKGKEDLLVQTVKWRLDQVLGAAQAPAEDDPRPASELLLALLTRACGAWRTPEFDRMFRLALGEIRVEQPGLFAVWVDEGPLRVWRSIQALIERGVRAGEFRAEVDAATVARLIVFAMSFSAILAAQMAPADGVPDPDAETRAAVDLVVRGLRAAPARGAHS
jgi:AcrR family transcriptional regulator